jgi:hypothetical protein
MFFLLQRVEMATCFGKTQTANLRCAGNRVAFRATKGQTARKMHVARVASAERVCFG